MPPRRQNPTAAAKLFVDRETPQRVFETAAFAIPPDRSIIRVYYGVGGQGKTALCRELWRKTDPRHDPTYSFLRRAELDLHGRAKDDPDRLLVWIRNGFAEAGVTLPCFDLALAIAWEATRGEEPFPKLSNAWLSRTNKFTDVGVDETVREVTNFIAPGVAAVAGDIIGTLPGVGYVLRSLSHWAIEKGKRAYLEHSKEALQALYRDGELRKAYELSDLLPWMLAQDLNDHLAHHPKERFVLFIDEYERVFDEGGAGAKWDDNPFDRHMRTLIQETNGLLAVVFSRERLPWDAIPEWREDLADAQHLLGGLSDHDADKFLRSIPIDDASVRASIIDGARETATEGAAVYPLMLDLQAEHWRTLVEQGRQPVAETFRLAAESFESRRQEIVHRVLRDYGAPLETTLERLSVARRFDRKAFAHVVAAFGTALPLDQFDRIDDLSFVTRGADGFLTLHNAIAETIRRSLPEEVRASSTQSLLEHFEGRAKATLPRDVTDETAAALTEAAFLRRSQGLEGYALWLDAAQAPLTHSRYAVLAALWREALALVEEKFGPDSPDVAVSLRRLGMALHNLGDYQAARGLLERAAAMVEAHQGADDPDTAAFQLTLGGFLRDMGDHKAARPLAEHAAAVMEAHYGADHWETAAALRVLGMVLHDQGESSAVDALQRAVTIYEKLYGAESMIVAGTQGELGIAYQGQGRLAEAQTALEKGLTLHEVHYGKNHPQLAPPLHNLAHLYVRQGKFAEARPLYERALELVEQGDGSDHPNLAMVLSNFADLLTAHGDWKAALPLVERALAIREKHFGPDHRVTARSLMFLATLLQKDGQLERAHALYQRALAVHERDFGSDSVEAALSANNLGHLLLVAGNLAEARPLLERALALYESLRGASDPTTDRVRSNVARLRLREGDVQASLQLARQALEAHEAALGPSHVYVRDDARLVADGLDAAGESEASTALREKYRLGPRLSWPTPMPPLTD